MEEIGPLGNSALRQDGPFGDSLFRMRGYASNLKWLLLANRRVLSEFKDPLKVLAYYLVPGRSAPLEIDFRNGESLMIPSYYVFEAIVETLLENVYFFDPFQEPRVVVDIGGSVGDFALLASRNQDTQVYTFEPDRFLFNYLNGNMARNNRKLVKAFNSFADWTTLESIAGLGQQYIDFLKIDCEGCEYDLLMKCSPQTLSRVRRISMEIHSGSETSKMDLIKYLACNGFHVTQRKLFGEGHYVYASNIDR